MENNNKDNKNNIFIVVLFLVIIVLVFFLPKIYNYVETLKLPKLDKTVEEKKEQNKEVDEETLESIHYPLMRSSIYDTNTYYNLKEFTISNMSNSDILLNAFLDMYEGNITNSDAKGICTNSPKQFNVDYLTLRIKNILGKNIKYTLDDFYVPEDSNSSYKGNWSYDSSNSLYIYNGLCESNITNTKYYNLEDLIKAEYSGNDIIVYYYVGFAKVEGNFYVMYSDVEMKNEISNGTFINEEELNSVFKSLDNKTKKVYKYTFKNTLCSYNEYCLYKGEWTNEL